MNKGCLVRTESCVANSVRRLLLRLYYSSAAIYQSPYCCGKLQNPPTKLQIVVLGLPGVGKTTFCLKATNFSAAKTLSFTTDPKNGDSILTFPQKRKYPSSCSQPTIIKYVELGGNGGLSQSTINSVYAQSYGVILLLDLNLYPCQASSLETLHSTLVDPFLKRKPILVVGSKLDLCPFPMDLSMFSRAFNLEASATEANAEMMAMLIGRKTKKAEIVENINCFLGLVHKNEEELSERIELDMRKLAKIHGQEEKEEVLLIDKLLEAARLSARASKVQKAQVTNSSEGFPEGVEPFPSGGAGGDKRIQKEEEKDDDCTTTCTHSPEESTQESDISDTDGEIELEVAESGKLQILIEPSWVEELDESPFEEVAPLFEKSDEPGEIPLRRVHGEQNLQLVDEEDGFDEEMKMTSDPVSPFNKFEITESEFGPDFYSSPVGGEGEPQRVPSSPRFQKGSN